MNLLEVEGAVERSTIWKELDSWAAEFKPWQRFLLAHCIREGTLTEERLDEAYYLLLREFELVDPRVEGIEIPADITGRPVTPAAAKVSIARVGNLKAVNALPDGAELTFCPGLTIVYGGNGAGKSGFGRIFANACFSRAKDPILPDVSADADTARPSAELVLLAGDTETRFLYDGETEHQELKRIAVFDTAVARTHLVGSNPLGYSPTGFDVFPEMARCYAALVRKLEEDIAARTKGNPFLVALTGPESLVSKAISALSAKTDLALIRALGAFKEGESDRLAEVQRQIASLMAQSIPEKLAALTAAAKEFELLLGQLRAICAVLAAERVAEYQAQAKAAQDAALQLASDTAKLFRHQFVTAKHPAFDNFLHTAKDLAGLEGEAYPQHGDHCFLCQQPLDSNSIAFLHSIWAVMNGDSEKTSRAATEIVHAPFDRLDKLNLDFFSTKTTCYAAAVSISPGIADRIIAFIDNIRECVSDQKMLLMGEEIANRTVIDTEIMNVLLNDLELLGAQIDADITRLANENTDVALAALQEERHLLLHKQILSSLLPEVEDYIKNLLWIETATTKVRRALNSYHITVKEAALFKTVVAAEYRDRFHEECTKFNCVLPVNMKTQGDRGKTVRSFEIGGKSPEKILSEGEQRCIALADFLTEVGLNAANAGIILDDPVTSQDHYRKADIARRLVEEANERQVIILTHDLVFLTMLSDEAKELGVTPHIHWIERHSDGRPGQISLHDSPAQTPQYKTTQLANATLSEAKEASGSARLRLIQRGLAELRRTIEEIIPTFVLKGIVNRWSDRIIVTGLKKINWNPQLIHDIVEMYETLSAHIEGHTHTEERAGAPPDLAVLEQRIADVNSIIKRARTERQSAA
jgi:hypothetical protein